MTFEHYFVLGMIFAIGCYVGGQFVTTFFWDNWAKIASDGRIECIRDDVLHDPELDNDTINYVLGIIDKEDTP